MEIKNCHICGKEFPSYRSFSHHLSQVHPEVSNRDYYDRFLKQPGDGVCSVCGKPTEFSGRLNRGYYIHCSKKCTAMDDAASKNGHFRIEIAEVDKDHIHLLVRIKPCESIDSVVKSLKQQSTYWMWKLHHDHLSRFYWSGQHHLWTRGYFASTIGGVSEQKIIDYIKNQG